MKPGDSQNISNKSSLEQLSTTSQVWKLQTGTGPCVIVTIDTSFDRGFVPEPTQTKLAHPIITVLVVSWHTYWLGVVKTLVQSG